MNLKTIAWKNNRIKIIDQTKLPAKLIYLYIDDLKNLWQAIKLLKVRGAPALGAAAALGAYLGIRDYCGRDFDTFMRLLRKTCDYIGSSRPTAKNLFWGLERIQRIALANKDKSIEKIKNIIFKEAQDIIKEDMLACRRIGYYGNQLFRKNESVLTICNAGILATIDYGTALGAIYRACQDKKRLKVFACETRPLLQGARLTTWELKQKGIKVSLICDNAAATLMRQGKIDKVIAGADRITANGDAANKIGTYTLAILSAYHKIPFYIAAPESTFDLNLKSGRNIIIEERDAQELTRLFFKKPLCIKGLQVFNPAFDVTPNRLISAIITDKGIIRPPYKKNITRVLGVGR